MRDCLFRKGLVIGIIVLLLGVSSTSLGIDVNKNIEIESEENYEIETLDEDVYEEIITFISGEAAIDWIKIRGILQGEAKIRPLYKFVYIKGWRHSNDHRVEKFYEQVKSVHAYRFFHCYTFWGPGYPIVGGFAFGNIEWE